MSDELLKTMNEAPELVKLSAASANRAFVRMIKAEKQADLWREEFEVATELHQAEMKAFNEILCRWNPDTQVIEPLEEFK